MVDFLVTVTIGTIIGYFTNWLAIKMLFRPYREKKLFGIRLPFTPGIIPKNRYQLSTKVGESVGQHLLTPEILRESIESIGVLDKIDSLIDENIDNIKNNDKSVDFYLELIFKENKNEYVRNLSDYVLKNANELILDEKFQNNIAGLINKAVYEFIKQKKIGDFSNSILDNSKKYIEDFKKDYINTDNFREFLNNYSDKLISDIVDKDYLLKDIISEEKSDKIKTLIFDNSPKIASVIEKFLSENPEVEYKIKLLIEKILDDNFGKLISMFISENKIYYNMKDGILNYLQDEENKPILKEQIDKVIDNILDRNLNFFIEKIDNETIISLKERLINNFTANNFNLSDGIFKFISNKIKNYEDESLYDIILKISPDYDKMSNKYILNITDSIAKEIKKALNNNFESYVTKLLNINLGALISKIDDKTLNSVKKFLLNLLNVILEKGIMYISQNMDIVKIVEERINSFEMEEAESIILSVVDRELFAITVLGGVLGFFISAIPFLIRTFA